MLTWFGSFLECLQSRSFCAKDTNTGIAYTRGVCVGSTSIVKCLEIYLQFFQILKVSWYGTGLKTGVKAGQLLLYLCWVLYAYCGLYIGWYYR